MPRFSLKDLFLSLTLISVGAAVWYLVYSSRSDSVAELIPIAVAGALIGTGISAPFKKRWLWWLAAILGVVASVGFYLFSVIEPR